MNPAPLLLAAAALMMASQAVMQSARHDDKPAPTAHRVVKGWGTPPQFVGPTPHAPLFGNGPDGRPWGLVDRTNPRTPSQVWSQR